MSGSPNRDREVAPGRVMLVNTPPIWPIGDVKAVLARTHLPLGLVCVGTSLRHAGFDVEIADLWSFPEHIQRLEASLSDDNLALCGMNASSPTLAASWALAEELRRNAPELALAVGGAHPSCRPQDLAGDESPFDYIVVGEGDKVMCDIASEIRQRPYSRRRLSASLPSPRIRRPKRLDLDSLPIPDLSLLDTGKYFASRAEIPLFAARGCEFGCRYCAVHKMFGSQVCWKSIERIQAEIEHYIQTYDVRSFKFINENIVGNSRSTFLSLLSALRAFHPSISWRAQLRLEAVTLPDIEALASSGCHELFFGIDAVSSNAQLLSNRRTNLQHASEIVNECCKIGIRTQAVFIVAFPNENDSDLLETVLFAKKLQTLGVNEITFFPLILLPGTPLWSRYGKDLRFGAMFMPAEEAGDRLGIGEYMARYGLLPECGKGAHSRLVSAIQSLSFAYSAVAGRAEASLAGLRALRKVTDKQARGLAESISCRVGQAYSTVRAQPPIDQ